MSNMDPEQTKGLNPRALAANALLCAGVVTAFTGLWLSLVRQMPTLRHVHLAVALVFTAAALWHGTYNLKPLTRYLLSRNGGGAMRMEARVALVVTLIAVLAGLLWSPGRPR